MKNKTCPKCQGKGVVPLKSGEADILRLVGLGFNTMMVLADKFGIGESAMHMRLERMFKAGLLDRRNLTARTYSYALPTPKTDEPTIATKTTPRKK